MDSNAWVYSPAFRQISTLPEMAFVCQQTRAIFLDAMSSRIQAAEKKNTAVELTEMMQICSIDKGKTWTGLSLVQKEIALRKIEERLNICSDQNLVDFFRKAVLQDVWITPFPVQFYMTNQFHAARLIAPDEEGQFEEAGDIASYEKVHELAALIRENLRQYTPQQSVSVTATDFRFIPGELVALAPTTLFVGGATIIPQAIRSLNPTVEVRSSY